MEKRRYSEVIQRKPAEEIPPQVSAVSGNEFEQVEMISDPTRPHVQTRIIRRRKIQKVPEKKKRRNFFMRHKFLTLLLLLLIGLYVYGWIITRPSTVIPEGQDLSEAQKIEYIREMGKKIILPTDESPKIFVVKDPAALSAAGDPFYQGAVAGDVVFLYENNEKAILWNPKEKRVVNVAPVRKFDGGQKQPQVSTSTSTTTSSSTKSQ